MSAPYSSFVELACRDDNRQAPFEKIAANPTDFIDAEFLPLGLRLTDPRSMKLESLVTFFKHISQREISHGIKHAFRFKKVMTSRKKGVLRRSRYIVDGDQSGAESDPPPVRRKRRKREPQIDLAQTILYPAAENTITPPNESRQNSVVEGSATPAIQRSRSNSEGQKSATSLEPATGESSRSNTRSASLDRPDTLDPNPSVATDLRDSISNIGLHTPSDTPVPPLRRSRRPTIITPTTTPVQPRRSQRTTAQNVDLSPAKKTRKKK